ncbi:unnamed protein product, partial [Prorocentrum cordatum]
MHWTFEAHLNRVLVPHDAVEFQLFSKFLGALRGLAASRTEWAIFAEHEGLAGSIDFVARDSAQWIAERYYGARVAAMHVVCLHPDNGDQPFVDDVPEIPDIEELMAVQRPRSRELRATASEDATEIDPLGGWPRPVVETRLPYRLSTAANFGAMATDGQCAAGSASLSPRYSEFGDPTPRGRARQRRVSSGARSLTPARRKRRLSSRAARAAAARSPQSSPERDDARDINAFTLVASLISDEAVDSILSCFLAVLRRTLARRFARDQQIRLNKTLILVKPFSSSKRSASRGPRGARLPGALVVVPRWLQSANEELAAVTAPSPVRDRCFICGADDGDVDGIGQYLEGCVATVKSFPFPEVAHLRATTSARAMLASRLEPHGNVFERARCSGVCVAWEDTLNIELTAEMLRVHRRRNGSADRVDCLENQVKGFAAGVSLLRPKRDSEGKCKFACGLCPFRSFSTQLLLRAHVSKYRVRETCFVASGTKQFNVVRALFDNDRLLRAPLGNLLKRSATTMRETVSPAVHRGQKSVDKDAVLVLDGDGPSHHNKAAVGRSLACRRVGYTYYTRGFADVLMQESLRHHGRVRPTMLRTCARVVEQGSELSGMLPTDVAHWLKLMEDAFNSARVEQRSAALMEERRKHQEFPHVFMDATIRILRRVKGQADYRSSQAVRDAAPVPDIDAKRRALTLAGGTGAALGVFLTRDEASDEIAGAITGRWSEARRSQTVSVASDQPSSALYRALRNSCFSNLIYLSLDPVHLPITHEETHWRKKTGIQAIADNHGQVHEGQILDQSFSKSRAQYAIDNVNAELPWRTTHEFIESIAALSALVPEELARRTHVNNVQLKRLLYDATASARMQWFCNNLRFMHSLPAARLALLGSGTSVNESFNHEVNTWFRNQGDIYASTAELQLRIGFLGKLRAHCCSLHSPTLRQLRQANVLSRSIMAWAFPRNGWKSYCALEAQCGTEVPAPARLPLREARQGVARRIAERAACVQIKPAAAGQRGAQEKPAARALLDSLRDRRAHRIQKTAFTLKRKPASRGASGQ